MLERLRRLPEAARALRIAKGLEAHEKWSAERLAAHQRQRLLQIVRHAVAHSPFYRERFSGIELSDDLALSALPTLDKATVLENFDDLVTDRRLKLAEVERHLAQLEDAGPDADPRLLGEYRAMATGGSSGQRGVFVYGRDDWVEGLAGLYMRAVNTYVGLTPRLPRRRLAVIFAESHLHITGRANRSIDIGTQRLLRLDARTPIDQLVEALNSFQPESLAAYASIASLLAERQLAGELQIAPRGVTTNAEVLTAEMEDRVVAAWDRVPFDVYATTETGPGALAIDCDRHAGQHAFTDLVLIEVLDEDYRPVPPGEPGQRFLVTSLYNRTQPLIRYELNDLVTLSPDPCPCGRPFPLIASVDGRSDDVLELPAATGGTIKVHPLTLRSPLAGTPAISEYRIVYAGDELRIETVLRRGSDDRQVFGDIEARLGAALAEQGARVPQIRIESVRDIARHPQSGKRKLIEVLANSA